MMMAYMGLVDKVDYRVVHFVYAYTTASAQPTARHLISICVANTNEFHMT